MSPPVPWLCFPPSNKRASKSSKAPVLIEPTDGAICAISAKVLTFKVLLILI